MIASLSNNFIFLKTRKTAGTSAEIVLSSWCNTPPDVCTSISDADEIIRREYGGPAPSLSYSGTRIHNHMPASKVRELFPALWDRAYKFTIERHPYEKAVSRVFWNLARRGGDPVAEFSTELEAVVERAAFVDRDIYTIDGTLAVDEVIKFEQMWARIAQLGASGGKTMPKVIPTAKGQHRIDRRPATLILSSEQKRRIREAAAFEFETFGFAADAQEG
jgi:hypothetical protein